jgi:phenylacetate-CoA ligase
MPSGGFLAECYIGDRRTTNRAHTDWTILHANVGEHVPPRLNARTQKMSQLLDIMRTRYLRLPRSIKAAIAPALRLMPASIRFGRTYWNTRQQIVRSETDKQFVNDYQLAALRSLLARAYGRSRYFGRVLDSTFGKSVGHDLEVFEIADLTRLPILTKTQIIEAPDDFLLADPGGYDVRFTSGSSGRPPAKIYLDRTRSVKEFAFLHHIWSRIGYAASDGRAILRDYANIPLGGDTWQYDPVLRELWLSPFYLDSSTMDQHLALLHRYRVRFLYGIPSAITLLARHATLRGWKSPKSLRGILCASETLFTDQRRLISQCFNVPVIAHYGMSERVAIAGEIAGQPDTYEFEPLYGIVELIDDLGNPVVIPGQSGRIVCTGLFSTAMALVRYQIGDRATLVRPATFDNCYRLRVCGLRSRWSQEYIVGNDGQKISVISLDQENYFGIIQEYQYVQSVPGVAIFRVVPHPQATKPQLDKVLAEISARVRGAIDFHLEIVPSIAVGVTGKRNYVDQRIPDAD